VDVYVADPLCGFIPSAGLVRSMMDGLLYIQNDKNLDGMKKDLPVFFIAGGDDPVGSYGTGVQRAVEEFKRHGMKQVDVKIYPLCRHEILNEINRQEVYEDVASWIENVI
jgi:alpha-beta hydrolase superfamily lysophospholipase